MQYLQPYWIGCRKHRQGVVVWCDSLPFVALELSFTRNAPLIENGRDLGSVVVSGFWMGTKVDSSIRVIHICQQTKWSLQLQAMLKELHQISPFKDTDIQLIVGFQNPKIVLISSKK